MTLTQGSGFTAIDVLPDLSPRQPRLRRPLHRAQPPTPALPQQRTSTLDESATASLVSQDQFDAAIASAQHTTVPMAVVRISLDRVRDLTTAFGPDEADAAVARAGELLAWVLAPAPVAQVSADTFATLLPDPGSRELEHRVRRALSLLATTDLSHDGLGISTTASAAITVLHRTETTVTPLVRQVREALDNNLFVLHAQPVQSVHQDHQQWELLVRLPGDDGALLPPRAFLPVAERAALGAEIDRWVTRRAIRLLAAWGSAGHHMSFEINAGPGTLGDGTLLTLLKAELAASGINPRSLVFEVDAHVAASHSDEVRAFAKAVTSLGCRFALDGLGGEDVTLDQLPPLPLHFVKLEANLVRRLATDAKGRDFVHALTAFAEQHGWEVIAKGVRDQATRALVVSLGVDYVQGFHVGPPIPLAATA